MGAALETLERNFTMATIGTFKKSGNGFSGDITTLFGPGAERPDRPGRDPFGQREGPHPPGDGRPG